MNEEKPELLTISQFKAEFFDELKLHINELYDRYQEYYAREIAGEYDPSIDDFTRLVLDYIQI